jgi:hypothetical protein
MARVSGFSLEAPDAGSQQLSAYLASAACAGDTMLPVALCTHRAIVFLDNRTGVF